MRVCVKLPDCDRAYACFCTRFVFFLSLPLAASRCFLAAANIPLEGKKRKREQSWQGVWVGVVVFLTVCLKLNGSEMGPF